MTFVQINADLIAFKRISDLFGTKVRAAIKVVAEVDAAESVPLRKMVDIAVSQKGVSAQFSAIILVALAAEGLICVLDQMESLSDSDSQDSSFVERSPSSIARRRDALRDLVEAIRTSPEVAALREASLL